MNQIKKTSVATAVIVIAVIASYVVAHLTGAQQSRLYIKISMCTALALTAVIASVNVRTMTCRDIHYYDVIIIAIMAAGIIMRIGYMLYTPCNIRQHDLWGFDADAGGHAAYILNLMQYHRLPLSNKLQFYQQPFFYIAGSLMSFVVNSILNTSSAYELADAARTAACTASCLMLPASDALCRECGIGGRGRVISTALVACSPVFYMTAGMLTPDSLSTLLMVLAVLYTIKWSNDCSWKNTVLLAVIYGLGVMTKVSVGVIALFTAVVFVIMLVKTVKTDAKQWKMLMLRYIVFGLISLPLGLWYSVRNYRMFGQPLGYVLDIGGSRSKLYTGDRSIAARIFTFSIDNIMKGPYADVFNDYNAPAYYLKSSLFGEYRYEVPAIIPAVLLFAALFITFIAVVAFIYQLIHLKNKSIAYYAVPVVSVLMYASVTYFYMKYPYGCSMDYRYMGLLSVMAGAALGRMCENTIEIRFRNIVMNTCKLNKYIVFMLTVFCLASVIMYVMVQ